jgi:DNA-binding transcriptional regulator LsrR (DeoR family)
MNEQELMEYVEEQSKLPRNKRHTQKEIAKILGIGERTLRRKISDYRNEEKVIEQLNIFTEEEIKVLKEIVKEYENNYFQSNDIQLNEYEIYKELEKVRTDAENHIRSAFNMSKETTERLKKFSSIRRIPLQDLVELAVINLLDKYDK